MEAIQPNSYSQINITNGIFSFINMAGFPWNMSCVLMPTIIPIEGISYLHH